MLSQHDAMMTVAVLVLIIAIPGFAHLLRVTMMFLRDLFTDPLSAVLLLVATVCYVGFAGVGIGFLMIVLTKDDAPSHVSAVWNTGIVAGGCGVAGLVFHVLRNRWRDSHEIRRVDRMVRRIDAMAERRERRLDAMAERRERRERG